MVLKNIIINKSSQNNISELKITDKLKSRLDKYNDLLTRLNSFKETELFAKIDSLDLYNTSIKEKILLYEPVEYIGWNVLLDIMVSNIINTYSHKYKILFDTDAYGCIELIKYITETNSAFSVGSHIIDSMDDKIYKYLSQMMKIKSVDIDPIQTSESKYDYIIISDIDKVKYYQQNLLPNGSIILIEQIKNINTALINNINQSLKIFEQIELLSPTILKSTGEYVCIFRKPTDTYLITQRYGNLMIKIDNFFDYHLHRLNNLIKSKIHIAEISNSDIQNKLISTYKNKLMTNLIDIYSSYNIPVKTTIDKYYDNKLITINNKLYSALNFISYQFIKYEDLDIEFNTKSDNLHYTRFHNIANNLTKIKRAIDTRYIKKWQYITYQLDNYKSLGEYVGSKYEVMYNKKIKPSNAFLKIYEMMEHYNIIKPDATTLKSFHFCEAPGMFIVGLNHYLQTKTNIKNWDFYGNSLSPEADKTALGDNIGLIAKYRNKWLIGPQSSGDIRELSNIDFFKSKLGEVDFITSDCGICVDNADLNRYEELIAETDFAQFVNCLNLLKQGGSCILKTFIPLELPSNICLIYYMSTLFKKLYLSKPITSRPNNSEVYLIGINFLGIEQNNLNKLKSYLNKDLNPKFDPYLNWIKEIPTSFISQLEDYVVDITKQQISYLLNIFHFVDNTQQLDKIKILKNDNKLKELTNIYWCDKFNFVSNTNSKLI